MNLFNKIKSLFAKKPEIVSLALTKYHGKDQTLSAQQFLKGKDLVLNMDEFLLDKCERHARMLDCDYSNSIQSCRCESFLQTVAGGIYDVEFNIHDVLNYKDDVLKFKESRSRSQEPLKSITTKEIMNLLMRNLCTYFIDNTLSATEFNNPLLMNFLKLELSIDKSTRTLTVDVFTK